MSAPPIQPRGNHFPCKQCGAQLQYNPGALKLKCPYCGFEQDIPADTSSVVPLDFQSWLTRDVAPDPSKQILKCTGCGAQFEMKANEVAGKCPFCAGIVVIPPDASAQIPPGCVLPFIVDSKRARDEFRKWVGSRFWAPNNLKELSMMQGGLTGVYVPYWSYDSATTTQYTGMRGIDRYITETYTDSDGNTQQRERVETDWFPAFGTVEVPFQDVLVLASNKVPAKFATAMKSWQLGGLVSYRDEFLSGFQAVRYETNLAEGFEVAKQIMAPSINQAVCFDIGGDRQQVLTAVTSYFGTAFKHALLPIWAGAYRYNGKTWQYLINGQTGEIRGESPVSWFKILLAVLLGVVLLVALFYIFGHSRSR